LKARGVAFGNVSIQGSYGDCLDASKVVSHS
jgi:hypothetical protein